MKARIIHGDCLDVMRQLAAEGVLVDSVVTDPPYHLTSIVKRFGTTSVDDQNDTGRRSKSGADGYARLAKGFMGKAWDGGDIAFRPETWALAADLMKPGAYLVAFASSRGYHRMVCAIEDAGFIIHPMIGWLTGQGFPKSHKVEAEGWEGWRYGLQSLKPALEPICLAQRPMSEKTGTANVLAHGTGALNIDATRIACGTEHMRGAVKGTANGALAEIRGSRDFVATDHPSGRWPANLCHDGSDEVLEAFAAFGEKTSGSGAKSNRQSTWWEGGALKPQSGVSTGGDTGTAARFFYSSKASATDRAGSKHPTVKPVSLMRWLCRLVTPPEGLILDPFAGSGSTLQAAAEEGFRAIGIEREAEYVADIERRLADLRGPLFTEAAA